MNQPDLKNTVAESDQATQNNNNGKQPGFCLSFPVGSLFGVKIRIHVVLPAVVVLQALDALRTTNPPAFLVFYLLLYGLIVPITVLVHELARALAAKCVGMKSETIVLWPLGGLSFIGSDTNAAPSRQLWVAFAGSLTHPPMMIAWFGLAIVVMGDLDNIPTDELTYLVTHKFFFFLCITAFIMNIIILVFNLCLPAYPLDGGWIFANLLLLCKVPVNLAAKIVVAVAISVAVLVIVWGIIQASVFNIFVGIFMLYSSTILYLHIRNGTVAQHPLFKHTAEQEQEQGQGSGEGQRQGLEEVEPLLKLNEQP